jgi:hypothetical protein
MLETLPLQPACAATVDNITLCEGFIERCGNPIQQQQQHTLSQQQPVPGTVRRVGLESEARCVKASQVSAYYDMQIFDNYARCREIGRTVLTRV